LPIVSESLTLTFNLLADYYSRQQPSKLWLGDVIFLGMELSVKRFKSELAVFAFFLEDDSTDLRELFYRVFRRKHLIIIKHLVIYITTHVEKQYTRALIPL